MARTRAEIDIHRPRDEVWNYIREITSHVEWMADARTITVVGEQSSGVGTTFDCLTTVGPLSLKDRLVVTEWQDNRAMAIRHVGRVTGTGRFSLDERNGTSTRFVWEEELHFPWWMAGPVGEFVGIRMLAVIWRRNLRALKALLEAA